MEILPHELVSAIGDFLLPKYRCRLFICCKEYYDKCYMTQKDFLKWYSNNKNNITIINQIKYNILLYEQTYLNRGKVHSSMRIIPYRKNGRILWEMRKCKSLFMRSYDSSFNHNYDGEIWYEDDPHETHYRYKAFIVEYYRNNMDICDRNAKIIFDNIDDIMKYLCIYDVFKLWVSLGFGYYYILRDEYCSAYHYIKRYRKEYRRLKKKLINNSFDIKL